ncbi:MAG TPA: hypothetical protein VGS28_01610 [Candidatus Saccharimonadales bacterium]|nr:hypothetical protein [Candidatus Saccharimonadales bacterium]
MSVGYHGNVARQEQFAEAVWNDLAFASDIQIIRLLGNGATHREQGYTTVPRTEMVGILEYPWGCRLENTCGRPPIAMARIGRYGVLAFVECVSGLEVPSHYLAQLEEHEDGELSVATTAPMSEHHVGQGLMHAGGDYPYEDVPDLQLVVRDRAEGLYVADIGSVNGTEIAVAGQVGPLDGEIGDELIRGLLASMSQLVGT